MSQQLNPALPAGLFTGVDCPTRVVLGHVTSKWGVLVLVALRGRVMRWHELRRTITGVSEKMLAQTLRTFESDGLVRRDARPVIPPYVEYQLTPLGDELVTLLLPLMEWLGSNTPAMLGGSASGVGAPRRRTDA